MISHNNRTEHAIKGKDENHVQSLYKVIPTRVVTRAYVPDILGKPRQNPLGLGQIYCRHILQRDFRPEADSSGYCDSFHALLRHDSTEAVLAWFLYDMDVREPFSKEEISRLPHEVYLASKQGEHR